MSQTYYYRHNTGGSNLRSSEATVNQSEESTEMVLLQNVDIYRDGGIQSQLGNVQLNISTDSTRVLGIGQFRNGDDVFIVYQKASGKAYVLPLDGGTETLIKNGLNSSAKPDYVEYNAKVIQFNGADQPWSWDGATATDLTGTPTDWVTTKPYTADVANGTRIFAASGSSIYWNALGNENDWTTANDAGQFSDVFNDNTTITNVSNYGSQLTFHTKKPSIFLLTGTAPADYAVKRIASNRAAIGVKSTVNFNDYQYFFSGEAILPIITTDLGQIKLGQNSEVSRKIKPFLTGTDEELPIAAVNALTRGDAVLLPYDLKNQMICYFRSTSSSNLDTAIILNFDTNAWVFRKATPVTCAARVGDFIITGTSTGKILKEFSGQGVVGNVFNKRILSPFFDWGKLNNYKKIIRFTAVFRTNSQLALTFNLYKDYSANYDYTREITSTFDQDATYGSAIYGQSTYANTGIVDIEFPVDYRAKRIQFELLSNDPNADFRLIYYSFEIDMLDAR